MFVKSGYSIVLVLVSKNNNYDLFIMLFDNIILKLISKLPKFRSFMYFNIKRNIHKSSYKIILSSFVKNVL